MNENYIMDYLTPNSPSSLNFQVATAVFTCKREFYNEFI